MLLDERIQGLCARAVSEQDPGKLAEILADLKVALRDHQREATALLHAHRKLFEDVA